jgi:signal transduction histidine kinase
MLTGSPEQIVIFGKKFSIREWIKILIPAYIVILSLLFGTRSIISGVELAELSGSVITYGGFMYAIVLIFMIGTLKNLHFLITARRKSSDKIFREFIKTNIIGFHLIFVPAIILLLFLPLLGYQTRVYAFMIFPVSVTIFYIAFIRYQLALIYELNISLENKVEERTAELKQTQVRLVQSEKMASLSQLVAGVAHEINNPLGAVKSMVQSNLHAVKKLEGYFENIQDENQDLLNITSIISDANKVINDGTNKISDIVKDLKSFAKLDEAEYQKVDVHKGIEDTLTLMQHEFKPTVNVTTDFGDLPELYCYPALLNQVYLNLFVNADQAIKVEGNINISTFLEKGEIHISITDTGTGINKKDQKRIFDPGFTTKGVGVGTGLGLPICYQIIKDHKGEIKVESDPGIGTSITVILPVNSR